MNQAKMNELKDFGSQELVSMSNSLNKKIKYKLIKDDYDGKVTDLNSKKNFTFQGLSWFRLANVTIVEKFKNFIQLNKHIDYKKELSGIIKTSKINNLSSEEINVLKLELKNKYKKNVNNKSYITNTNKYLDNLWKSRKNAKIIIGFKFRRNEIANFKHEYKKDIKTIKLEYSSTNKIRVKNKLLISSNGNMHTNKFLHLSKRKILEYKLKIKNIKFKKFESKFEKQLAIYEIKSKYSYDGELKLAKLRNKIEFFTSINNSKIDLKNTLFLENEKKKSIMHKKLSEKSRIKGLLKVNKLKYFGEIGKTFKNIFSKKIRSKGVFSKIKELFREYKYERRTIIFGNEVNKVKFGIKSIKLTYKNNLKKEKVLYLSKNIEENEKIPIYCSAWRKYISTFFSFIFPGLGEIINGQIIKGIVMLPITLIFTILIMYAFGIGNLEGNGIFGLISLGHADKIWENGEARYFLIEGVFGVVFIALTFIYCAVSAYNSYYIAKTLYYGGRTKTWLQTKNYLNNIGYPITTSLPSYILVIFVIIIPVLTTVLLAFSTYNQNSVSNFKWGGFKEFEAIFTKDWSKTMLHVTIWTLEWTIATWIMSFVIAFVLALVSNNERIKGKFLFRVIYILPWAIPGFITILLFKVMFSPGGWLSNQLGMNNILMVETYAKVSLLLIQMWSGYCVNYVLITGILQSISKDLYEAAEIDGANSIAKTFKVTAPLVIYQMTPILVGQFMACFNNFAIIYMYLNGGPYTAGADWVAGAGATDTIASLIYKLIGSGNVGQASALNVVVSIVIVIVSLGILSKSKSVKGGIK